MRMALAVAAILSMLVAAPASADPDTIGAPGIGDPYYPLAGNGGYDVAHYDIRLSYQPGADELWGTTTVLAKATQDLTQFDVDFLLRPSEVRVNNAPAEFESRPDGELVIRPAHLVRAGSRMTVVVRYRDTPGTHELNGRTGWEPRPDGVFAIGEPSIAAWWYPANDHPLDKASYDVSVAVPAGLEVISNGTLTGTRPEPNGWQRWHWRSKGPQGTYQTSMLIGDFDLSREVTPDGQPVISAYEVGIANADTARTVVDRTPEVVAYLSTLFGPYPFESQGGVVVAGYAGLENQTRPTYGDFFFGPDFPGSPMEVIAHEMAHQWFGNSVSVHHWSDLWLAEGFAQYAQYLWTDHTGGTTVAQTLQQLYDAYPPDHALWDVVVADPGQPDNFHAAVYNRGAFALQSLRVTVGDQTFFRILRTWAAAKRGGNATTAEFVAHAERVSGRQLDDLFTTWIYTAGKPAVGPNTPF